MGALRDGFWTRPLGDLNQAEWEALCDGCGRCCLHKVEDADSGEVYETNVACELLDVKTARCTDYKHRKARVPDCVRLTLKVVDDASWLPETCAYRRRAADRPLPDWHYLVSGDPLAVRSAGASVHGRVIPEGMAGPIEHHLVEWDDVDGPQALDLDVERVDE